MDVGELAERASAVLRGVSHVVQGKHGPAELALITMLAEGHLLVEDIPGVGKTSMAKALATALGCSSNRVQFTPDLMPSDITGVSVFDRDSGAFQFRPGPIFAHVVIGDEINRASPKTQSALLECMSEQQVTVDGATYPLKSPFMVVATQNPVEMDGIYALPEAQRDRFTCRISLGYPDAEAELAMLDEHASHDPMRLLRPTADPDVVQRMLAAVREVHVAEHVRRYVVRMVAETRHAPAVRLGCSPRATLHLLKAAKAAAALEARPYVIPDDVVRMAVPVLAHRLLLAPEAMASHRGPQEVVERLVRELPAPRAAQDPEAHHPRRRE